VGSFRRKDGGDDDASGEDLRGKTRSNDTHASTNDPDARMARKGGMSAELRHMGHALIESR